MDVMNTNPNRSKRVTGRREYLWMNWLNVLRAIRTVERMIR
jgi:hypothetical protein